MKGVVLAGGNGTRLHPLTLGTSKQLMPVFDKPMIYYPITTLILAGIREILVITNPHESNQFRKLLGDGSQWGIELSYASQDPPRGVAEAFTIGSEFIRDQSVALILGDNIFHGPGLGRELGKIQPSAGAVIMAYQVSNPSAYGVVEMDNKGRAISIEEKPVNPRSRFVIPGLYFYGPGVSTRARGLKPSARGELEIADLNNLYLKEGNLKVLRLERGSAWLDTGNFESLLAAGNYIRIVEERQGIKIGCPEEAAWRMGYIDDDGLRQLGSRQLSSGYGRYLLDLVNDEPQ